VALAAEPHLLRGGHRLAGSWAGTRGGASHDFGLIGAYRYIYLMEPHVDGLSDVGPVSERYTRQANSM